MASQTGAILAHLWPNPRPITAACSTERHKPRTKPVRHVRYWTRSWTTASPPAAWCYQGQVKVQRSIPARCMALRNGSISWIPLQHSVTTFTAWTQRYPRPYRLFTHHACHQRSSRPKPADTIPSLDSCQGNPRQSLCCSYSVIPMSPMAVSVHCFSRARMAPHSASHGRVPGIYRTMGTLHEKGILPMRYE